jgi:replicative DNA helicase
MYVFLSVMSRMSLESYWESKERRQMPPPNNEEAEGAVIGSVLINPELYSELSQFLTPQDFRIYRNRWIWEAFTRLDKNKSPIDILTVLSELEEMKVAKEIGGLAYLTQLAEVPPNSANAISYGRIVERESVRRKLTQAASAIANDASNSQKSLEELIADSIARVQTASVASRKTHKNILQLAEEHKKVITQMSREPNAHLGIMTSWPDVNKLLGFGLQKKFMILAGRPGWGKTSMAIQIALEAAKQGKVAAIFSLEMDESQLTNVIMSMLTGIDNQRLAVGKLTTEEWEIYNKASIALGTLRDKLILISEPMMSVPEIRSKCLSIRATLGLDLVIIDYLLRINGYEKYEQNDRANFLTADLAALKAELDCALILVHHMNRAFEHRGGNEPQLSDLNEGGERDPDIVAFLHPDKDAITAHDIVAVYLSFVKHRGGPTGRVSLLFRGSCTTFITPVLKDLKESKQWTK